MNYSIRKILPFDKDEFIKMSREFYSSDAVLYNIDDSFHFSTFDELMRSDVYLECYIFETDKGKIAGYALLDKMFSHEAAAEHIRRIRLETEPENEGARALYKRKGFKNLEYLQMVKDV